MLSPGELYDMRGDIDEGDGLSTSQQNDLIDECHRLRHLIEEMASFRESKQHQDTMRKLCEIQQSMGKT